MFFPLPQWDQSFNIVGICKLPRFSLAVFLHAKPSQTPLPAFFFAQCLVSPTFGIQDTVFLPSSQLATVFWSILHG